MEEKPPSFWVGNWAILYPASRGVDLKPPLLIIQLNLDNSNSPQLELSFLSFDKKNSKKFTRIIRIQILLIAIRVIA